MVLLIVSSCRKEPLDQWNSTVLELRKDPLPVPDGDPYTREDLDRRVLDTLEGRNDFQWEWMDLKTIWSALQYNDHALAIGYQPSGVGNFQNQLASIDIQSDDYKQVHDALLTVILDEVKKVSGDTATIAGILVEDDPVLPIITIRTQEKVLLTRLYNIANVRYLEPLDYFPKVVLRSGSGCGGSLTPINAIDYSIITPGSLVPWNYSLAGIPAAWNYGQGQGITIGVIDAGISSAQSLLNTQFNSGYSSGRSLNIGYVYGTTAYTSCVHGTSMCGLAAGPRNTMNATTGVAYKANLNFVRACDDVVLTSSGERLGVKNALVYMGNTTNLRIISMSIGTPFSSSVLKDGVDYAYAKGKLIFAAAGTSYTWTTWYGVIYPAAYSSCIAVTGIRENGTTCSTCHDGSAVQFTVVMERTNDNDRNSLSLPPFNYVPTYVGGSSSATATSAGIAALVWSVKPAMTRDQLYYCIRNTAQYFPLMDAEHGYGKVNAMAAVNYAISHY